MPVTSTRMKSGKQQQRIDAKTIAEKLKAFDVQKVVLEQVGAMPGQGVTSTFNFGHGAGVVETVARLSCDDVVMVRPSVWKKSYGLTADKDGSRTLATTIAGSDAHWRLKKHDGRAEAYLLACLGLGQRPLARMGLDEHLDDQKDD